MNSSKAQIRLNKDYKFHLTQNECINLLLKDILFSQNMHNFIVSLKL